MTKPSYFFAVLTLLISTAAFPSFMHAQQFAPEKESSSLATNDLPDAPGALLERGLLFQEAGAQARKPGSTAPAAEESRYRRVIRAGHTAQPLSAGDKMLMSLLSRATLAATGRTLLSTSFGYWRNDTPHYGTDLPAFGERFGAAELRQTSQSFFSHGLYAAAFHDDPRYYVMGPKEKVTKRVVYAATRVFVTRKDDGSAAANWPVLLGVVSSAALTNAYYPPPDRRVGRTVTSSLSIIGTSAATNQLSEFMGDIVHHFFPRKQDADQSLVQP